MDTPVEVFKGRIADPATALEQLDSGAKVGEIDVEVAVYGVPDTGRPYGVSARQVIDHGAFDPAIRELRSRALPYFVDHGHVQVKGFVDSQLKIGKADKLREEADALVFRGLVNLRTQLGKETFSQMLFDPENSPHSFRWNDEVTVRGEDGFDHVTAFDQLIEMSSVGRGAQMATGVRPETASMRSAMTPHSTETYDGTWDGPAQVAKLPNDASVATMRSMFAWSDPSGDASTKADYKFAHHTVNDAGDVDGANITACRTVIANLNGARSAPHIPAQDRRGVYAHVAQHLKDAGENVPELRASLEEITGWLGDADFAAALREMIGETPVPTPEPSKARSWLDELVADEMRKGVIAELRTDADARALLRAALEDSEAPSPVFTHYDKLWASRA